jgi:hypothetical protein
LGTYLFRAARRSFSSATTQRAKCAFKLRLNSRPNPRLIWSLLTVDCRRPHSLPPASQVHCHCECPRGERPPQAQPEPLSGVHLTPPYVRRWHCLCPFSSEMASPGYVNPSVNLRRAVFSTSRKSSYRSEPLLHSGNAAAKHASTKRGGPTLVKRSP